MGAQIRKRLVRPRATRHQRELALDLTSEEVVLHEGSPREGWRRFAGVALEDPEFVEVIGLLRAEAESAVGAGPVRLWLPQEQVLRLRLRIEGRDANARLRAAFAEASRETGHPPADIAVALAPAAGPGMATLLVTFAATWHEARDYAARWGFVPGPVSTRHHAGDFGPEGPVFLLERALREREAASWRRPAWIASAAAGLVLAPLAAMASEAPATAPLPAARVAEAVWTAAGEPAGQTALEEKVGGRSAGFAAILPPAKPAPPGQAADRAPGGDAGSEPATEAAAAPSSVTPPGDGLAAPRPVARPARAVAPEASAPGPAVAAAGAGSLPPVRPDSLPARKAAALRPDSVALVGILNLDSGREALLRLPDGAFVAVRTGEVLDGWTIGAIGPDTMQVRRGAETLTLLLVSR